MSYRILVTGSRDWADTAAISEALGNAERDVGPGITEIVVVHGDCPTGADRIADDLATSWGWRIERHPAEWDRLGRSAGYLRNGVMVGAGADLCLAFIRNGSRGASHTADLAEKVGIETRRYLA